MEDELPRCDCGSSLSCEGAHGRDDETLGGFSVEYFWCEQCGQSYDRVEGEDPCQCDPPRDVSHRASDH